MLHGFLFGACGFIAGAAVSSSISSGTGRRALAHNNPSAQAPKIGGRKRRTSFSGNFEPYELAEVIPLSHDVALFRFLLHDIDDEFNLRPCSTLQARMKLGVQAIDNVVRFYTPVTPNRTRGFFDIIVKRKQSGRMTEHLFGMHVGDKLLFRSVAFKMHYQFDKWKQLGMIAGGTGFTPMLQVIRHSLMEVDDQGRRDHTKLSFLFCNRTEREILLKGLFDDLAKKFPDRFRMFYCVDQSVDPAKWPHYTGYVTREMIEHTMPPPSDKSMILLCGPDQLLHHVAGTPMNALHIMSGGLNIQPVAPDLANLTSLGGILGELGYEPHMVYKF